MTYNVLVELGLIGDNVVKYGLVNSVVFTVSCTRVDVCVSTSDVVKTVVNLVLTPCVLPLCDIVVASNTVLNVM